MKRIALIAALVAGIAAIAVPSGIAKPLKPGPAQQARLDAANAAPHASGWIGIAVLGGLTSVALIGTSILVVRRRQAGRPAAGKRVRPELRSDAA